MLKWIARNKYKLMVTMIGVYLVVDGWQHRGQIRVWLPKSFPAQGVYSISPANKNTLVNSGKEWEQAVNTIDRMNHLSEKTAGLECDVYFDLRKNSFDVHHDLGRSTGLGLETLLLAYADKKLTASIWLDFKNLDKDDEGPALAELIRLRNKFGLTNKLLVESSEAALLSSFSDSGFYTSYYTPLFNPYLTNEEETKKWVDSLNSVISHSKVNALSGYYFQYPFLHHYFPNYPILTWAADDCFSLVNWLFKKKLAAADELFIVLYP